MSNTQIETIFGTPIGLVKIEQNTDILQADNNRFKSIINEENPSWRPARASENMRILEFYPEIKKILLDHFISFSSQVLGLNNQFQISTSWLTKCEQGEESGDFHFHANSFWSGIYYYGENYCESSSLEFENPLIHYMKDYGFYITPEKITQYNNLTGKIAPTKNTLIFFPSFLNHRILEHKSEFPRYSLAFNMVPIGEYGEGDSAYNTSWFH